MSNITALAGLFPQAFTVEKWRPHRPLKIGIHTDLIAAGVLTSREVRHALHAYAARRMYLAAVAAGGFRFDLQGNLAGEVTPSEAAWAREKLAELDAETAERARALKRPTTAPASSKEPTPSSITDLRAAAAARRAATADAQRLAS
jgi:sRNA-binding protein